MAFELDHTESLRETWLWRKAPQVVMCAGVLWLLGGEAADWLWQRSLRESRCTVVAAKVEGEIQVSGTSSRRRRRPQGQWVETTTVDFQVDGIGPRRSVQRSTDFKVGDVRHCWVSGDDVYLYPQAELLGERWSRAIMSAVLVVLGLGWLWQRRSAPATSA